MALVYVVDDFANVISAIRRELRVIPASVVGFTNPLDALKDIEEHPPDVLVTDLLMLEMNGVELARQIRARLPRMSFIVVSTSEADVLESFADAPGLVGTVRKPWEPGSIASLVRSALAS